MVAPPRPRYARDGAASLHASCVALAGAPPRALLIAGPDGASSGTGKSGLAAQLVALGLDLVADDLCGLRREGADVVAYAPPAGAAGPAPRGIELRGFGIVALPGHPCARVAAMLLLAPSLGRLPAEETVDLLGAPVPLLRHPYRFDLAAKALLWLRSVPNA
jgi:HPr kinase/phosphorylase